ncbi:hypothetical protein LAZ67_17002617 [Cordylochernes scorpioides]|uniref:Transgelin n=1 Tax=Cordylochernes scorpioides TaxID=51811 RepID=A0ABY6LE26_9ARAC|nr:hypothetical protein LAZ67_17002617 [Cordylochernes scorpioides]
MLAGSQQQLQDVLARSQTLVALTQMAQAKFDFDKALEALDWVREVTKLPLEPPNSESGFKDQLDFANALKDGTALCMTPSYRAKVSFRVKCPLTRELQNSKNGNFASEKFPFEERCPPALVSSYGGVCYLTAFFSLSSNFLCCHQRENLELFLKGCVAYGLKSHDLFQVNDLFEKKNLYTVRTTMLYIYCGINSVCIQVVNCIHALGGLAKKKGFDGPTIGVQVAKENPRTFDQKVLNQSKSIIGLQAGTNKGASQAGMRPYGASRQILPDGK